MGAWIRMLSDAEADADLADALAGARTPHGTVDNVLRVHSLRPNTMRGHMTLYKAALHDEANTIPMWLQETVASYVSILNDCAYSLANHWANARHLMGDEAKADAVEAAINAHRPEDALDGQALAVMRYAEKLTLAPADIVEADVEALRAAGLDDGQILEANQIICYFNYVNRSINGLGVTTDGDIVGYYAEAK
ncbi:MAG: peroxidase-related enzyme [Paracoccaceae bacterium]|nr:peroxidase-related enzyme [Paracoccaceae bacterium]